MTSLQEWHIDPLDGGGRPDDDRRRGRRGGERLRERGDVLAAVDRILRGEQRFVSRALLVEGGAGYGKTSVLNSARVRALQHGWSVAMVECRPSDSRTPFATAAGLFADLGGERLDDATGDGPDAMRRRLTQLIESTGTAGVLLLVDEARLGDDATWEWFLDLAAQPPSVPFAMVLSAGPRLPGAVATAVDSLAAHPTTQVFGLRGLSEAAIADLIRERVGVIDGDHRLPPVVAAATRGNPFLVHRAASALGRFGGTLNEAIEGDVWRLPSASVAGWTLARIRDLPIDSLALLRAVSVLGDAGDLRSVEAVASAFGGVADIGAMADQLCEREVLHRNRTLGFIYPLVALSIYDEVSPVARSTAHMMAAQQLRLRRRPESEVAVHLLHTEPDDDESTVDACLEAAQRVLDADGDVALADRFLARALAEPPSRDQRPALHALRAQLMARSGRGDPLGILREAFALDSDVPAVFRSGLVVVDQRWDHSVAADVVQLLRSVADHPALGPSDRLELSLAEAMIDGRPDAGLALLSMQDEDHDTLHRVVEVAGHVLAAGRATSANFDDLLAAVHVSFPVDRLVRSTMLAQVFQQLVTILIGSGDVDAASALLDLAHDVPGVSEEDRLWHVLLRAEIQLAGGRLMSAERELSAVLGSPGVAGTLAAEAAATKLALLMHLRGNPPYAVGLGETPVRLLRSRGQICQQLRVVESEAALRYRQGDWKGARTRYRVARELAGSAQVDNPAATEWRLGTARALHASGEHELARHHAVAELDAATAFGAPRPLANALRVVALTAESSDARVAMLEHARSLLADRPLLFEQCETLVELGVAFRDTGHDDDARDALREAADLAVRMGAGALMSTAHHELVAAGARPRRLAMSGASALTPAERKVAAMAASGRKNVEIAADLYISIKTVESHLARVYRKLQIDGRVELAEQWMRLTEFGDAR